MDNAIKVAAGVLAFTFFLAAIYFGINQSWPTAILFFALFGGLEFTIWTFINSNDRED